MKTSPRLLKFLAAIVACSAISGLSVVRADDHQSGGDDVNGNESFHVEMAMTPTPAAPAGSSVRLKIEAEDDHGSTGTELKLETKGLAAGNYNVVATLKSNGSTVNVGTFTLPSAGEFEVEFSNNPEDEPGDDDNGGSLPLPAGFNPLDVATVSITDANNVVLFTADLTQIASGQNMNRNATVTAQPGSGAPTSNGTGILTAFTSGNKAKGSVQLIGAGLPTKTKVSVLINGVLSNVKKTGTDKMGRINVRVQPQGRNGTVANGITLFQVTSIEIRNSVGATLLSASF